MSEQKLHGLELFCAALAGVLFGLGLLLAGMANPAKVLGFLDIAGLWDPSLILVMLGAISIGLLAFTFAKNRSTSLLGLTRHMPTQRQIDKPLVFGSVMFGIGWGLAGICPGPALVLLGAAQTKGIFFVFFMLLGMKLFELGKK